MTESTKTDWKRFESHREIVTNMVLQESSPEKVLEIWGAGLCNDINLSHLLDAFREIRLVDLDQSALENALVNQNCQTASNIVLYGGIDLTGIHESLCNYKSNPSHTIRELVENVESHSTNFGAPVDVLVSNAVLSQIVFRVVDSVGEANPGFVNLLVAVRNRHLDLMVERFKQGGVGILVTDFNSSIGLPELSQPVENLGELLNQALARRNHFHGLNPKILYEYLSRHSRHRHQLSSVQSSSPWVWDGPGQRHYACVAFRFAKKQE